MQWAGPKYLSVHLNTSISNLKPRFLAYTQSLKRQLSGWYTYSRVEGKPLWQRCPVGPVPPVPPHGHSCWVLSCWARSWERPSVMCCNLRVKTIIKAGPVQTRNTSPILPTTSTSSQHVAIQHSHHSLLASQRAMQTTLTCRSISKAESNVRY